MDLRSEPFAEHPLDVLNCLANWQASQHATALCVIKSTMGGAVRAVGALMAVRADGLACGYVSGGCIDADLVLRAQNAIAQNRAETIRYGAGSPFVDLPLPCGGAITIAILSNPEPSKITQITSALSARSRICVQYTSDDLDVLSEQSARPADAWHVTYTPKLRVRLAGRGADCLALARIAKASGLDLLLQCVDGDDVEAARAQGLAPMRLDTPGALPEPNDDAWTAFVLMFHDSDWETPLLQQALQGEAFYIGAVGSRHTHSQRLQALSDAGVAAEDLKRVHGPIGLVPSLRNASQLAISALAEVIDHFEHRINRMAQRTAIIVLAAGQSQRFECGDKLTTKLNGAPILAQAINAAGDLPFARRIAVTTSSNSERAQLLDNAGWQVISNPRAKEGQASSLQVALKTILGDTSIQQILILLGDMPFIPKAHIEALLEKSTSSKAAIMTETGGALQPPALVQRHQFTALQDLKGDDGAKQALLAAGVVEGVALPGSLTRDIDTVEDLHFAEATSHG